LSDSAERAKEIVARLASGPRFAGSEAEREARQICEASLLDLGFEVTEERFTYSQFPARFAPLICGSIFAAGVLLAGHLFYRHHLPLAGITAAFAGLIIAAALGSFLLARTSSLSSMRSTASNLVATRRNASVSPALWLVAHTDSKSQTIPMLVRVGSVGAAGIFFTLLIAMMIADLTGFAEAIGIPARLVQSGVVSGSVITAISIVPVALCFITNNSPGALDNATGVAAVLLAVEHLKPDRNVGVLLTSAEEMGLAGARAFVAARSETGIAINCDTIDSSGGFICMSDDRRRRDAVAMSKAGDTVGEIIRVRPVIRGILTDSMAFRKAGWESCTLSRGNLGTLARVHTSRDEPGRGYGAGVALAARILAATVEELS
jgi:hypothetical protein